MERGKVMKTSHGNMTPKSSPTLRDRDASFSTHLIPHQLNKCEQHHTIRPAGRFTAPDHDSTPELSIFNANKYFNEVTSSSSSNSRVSPLVNMNSDIHKHNPDQGRDTTKTRRSYSFASSSVDGHTNTRNYRAHSFHAATPTSSSSSEASCHSQACLASHPPTAAVSVSTTRNYPPHHHNSTILKKKIRASWSKPIWRLFRRKCPFCSCKKSVQVNETTPNPKPKTPVTTPPPPPLPQPQPQPQPQPPSLNAKTPTITNKLERDHNETANTQRFQPAMSKARMPFTEAFTFPALAATTSPHSRKHVLKVVHEEDPIPPRQSLEVFQPTVDRDYRRQNAPSPPSPRSRAMDVDDAASDASSDLFEIESFSTQAATLTCPITAPDVSECHEPERTAGVGLSLAGDTRSGTGSSSDCAAAAERDRRQATTGTTNAL